jgi:O-antigen/teichoic acid export membrane protein
MIRAEIEDDATPVLPDVARSIAETAITTVALGGLGIVTGVLVARWLGPVGRGELAAIQMWPSVVASIAMVGLPEALVYFAARHPSQSRELLVTASLTALVGIPIFAALGYALMPFLLSMYSDRVVQGARGYLWILPIYALVFLPHHALRGIHELRVWNGLRIIPGVLWLLVLLFGFSTRAADPVRIATMYVGLLGAVGIVMTWTVWRRATGPAVPTARSLKSLVRFGFPSALSTLPQLFNLRLDQMAVAAVLPARQLGVYVTAVAWSACVPMLSGALALVVSPRIAAEAIESERRLRFTRGVQGAVWLIAVPVAVLLAVAPFGITVVFGLAFEQAVRPAMILVIASGVNAFNGMLEELLRGSGRPDATFFAETIGAVAGLPALYLLLPLAGLTGASIASLVGYVAATIVLLLYSRRAAGVDVLSVIDPRRIRWSDVSAEAFRALRLRLGQP